METFEAAAAPRGLGPPLPAAEPRVIAESISHNRPPEPSYGGGSCCGRQVRGRQAGHRRPGRTNSLDEPMVAPSRDSNGVLQAGGGAVAAGKNSGLSASRDAKTHTDNPMVGAAPAPAPLGARKPGATMGSGGNGVTQGAAEKAGGPGATAQPARMVAHRPATSSYQNGRRQRGRRVERWSNGKLMKHTSDSRAERVPRALEQMNWLIDMEAPQPQRCRTVLIRYSHFASAPDVSGTWLALQAKLAEIEASEEHASRQELRQGHAEQIVLDTWSNIFTQVEPFTGREISPPPNLMPTMSPAASPLMAPAAAPPPGVAVTHANPGVVSTLLDLTLVEDDPGADLQLTPGQPRVSSQSRDGAEFIDGAGQHHLESLRKGRHRSWRSADDHNRGSGRHNRPPLPTDGMPSPTLGPTPEGGMTLIPPLDILTHPMHIGSPGLKQPRSSGGGGGVSRGSMRKSASFESSSTFGVALDSPPPVSEDRSSYLYPNGVGMLPTVMSSGSAHNSYDGGLGSPNGSPTAIAGGRGSPVLEGCRPTEGPPSPILAPAPAAGAGPPQFVHIATTAVGGGSMMDISAAGNAALNAAWQAKLQQRKSGNVAAGGLPGGDLGGVGRGGVKSPGSLPTHDSV